MRSKIVTGVILCVVAVWDSTIKLFYGLLLVYFIEKSWKT